MPAKLYPNLLMCLPIYASRTDRVMSINGSLDQAPDLEHFGTVLARSIYSVSTATLREMQGLGLLLTFPLYCIWLGLAPPPILSYSYTTKLATAVEHVLRIFTGVAVPFDNGGIDGTLLLIEVRSKVAKVGLEYILGYDELMMPLCHYCGGS
jgi:hypothetical protein